METFERQYSSAIPLAHQHRVSFPCMANQTWLEDPKRLIFMLARYKHAGSLLRGCQRTLELGCGDGFGSNITAQFVAQIDAIDADPLLIEEAQNHSKRNNINFFVHEFGSTSKNNPIKNRAYDGIFSLDVFEHLDEKAQIDYIKIIKEHLKPDGRFICGIPSIESQTYASPRSKAGHINCMSSDKFIDYWKSQFKNVQLFGMNDEVLHTGFGPMCHYLMVNCTNIKHD